MTVLANLIKVYGFGKIQDLLTLHGVVNEAGYSMGDLSKMVDQKQRLMQKKARLLTPEKTCECGADMRLMPVNTGPGDQTGDNSKHVWFCNACLEQEFTNQTYNQIIAEAERLRGG